MKPLLDPGTSRKAADKETNIKLLLLCTMCFHDNLVNQESYNSSTISHQGHRFYMVKPKGEIKPQFFCIKPNILKCAFSDRGT